MNFKERLETLKTVENIDKIDIVDNGKVIHTIKNIDGKRREVLEKERKSQGYR